MLVPIRPQSPPTGCGCSLCTARPHPVPPRHSLAAGRRRVAGRRAQTGGYTPLHEAALNADVELIDLLFEYGASAAIRNDEGQSAVDLARAEGHDDIAVRLEARLGA